MVRFEKETLLVHQTASGASYEIDVYRYDPPTPQRLYIYRVACMVSS